LQSQAAATPESDYETKAVLLHALAVAGQGDFAVANRLFRNRPALSSAAMAYLALALIEIDRKPMATELLVSLAKRSLDAPMTRGDARHALVPWNAASAELRALVALGLQKAAVEPAKTKELVDWLLAHRVGHRWTPEKATGPATLALCEWFAKARFQGEHYQLTVYVNEKPVKTIDVGDQAETQTVEVPPALLKKGKQRVNFTITGRGEYTYQCVLGGFVPAGQLKSTNRDWAVYRYYQPAPLEVDGREVPRGFDVLQGGYTPFRNKLTQLPVGRRGHVELYIGRHNLPPESNNEQLEYLVITEPLPSGVTVIEKSVRGAFERFEVAPGAITFYVGNRRHVGTIEYEVHGYVPGEYQAAPTVLHDAYRPERLSVGSLAALTVLPLGATSGDLYRLTPRELFELGKLYFAKKDYKRAASHLVELINKWNTNADVYKESARILLDVHLETGPAHEIVRYFEIIKERWPDLEIPFSKILKVAAAYHDIGEYERSYLVYRATAQSSFQRESELPGFLDAQKEFLRSVTVMQQLLLSYPPEAYIAEATEALAEQVYAKAATANDDPKLREQKVFRVDLIRRAALMLDDFLTEYPTDPAADQASFALANALLELKDYKGAIAACSRYAERFRESELVDSFWYVIGFGHFALGQHEQALEMCKKVAEAKRLDKRSGREEESRNKWRAVYIRGQVYHSLGRALEAIREYERVADKYADAKEAIDYFRRKAIELPEVLTVKPNQPAEVELKFRNIARCDVKVYKIDLMTFTLLERNLQGVTRINLAGIRPHHEAAIELGNGEDFHDRSQKLKLPLKEEGAYLVVARGADLHTSGLVLVSPLAVEIQEDAGAGRVRATVRDALKEGYVPSVHVKVIGTRNDDFVSGDSDLRGVFVADGIKGAATVVAQATGNRYAFYRGRTELGPPPVPAAQQGAKAPAQQQPAREGQQVELLEDLMQQNRAIQQDRQGVLQRLYEKRAKGVEVKGAFDQ
jgi:tetratricopeptide (TPR) repeat protein